jgi:hypothetical protein
MTETELSELAEDIKANGLRQSITLTPDGEILDGKSRELACTKAGVTPRYETFEGDPISYSISMNKLRRQMTASKLGVITTELGKLLRGSHGGDRRSKDFKLHTMQLEKTIKDYAREAGIGPRTIDAGRTLIKHGEANIVDMVRTGQVGIQGAAAFAKNTPREQQHQATVRTVKNSWNEARKNWGTKKSKPAKRQMTWRRAKDSVPPQLNDVVGKLDDCAKRLKELSLENDMTLSFTSFRMQANILGKLMKELREAIANTLPSHHSKTKGNGRTPLAHHHPAIQE